MMENSIKLTYLFQVRPHQSVRAYKGHFWQPDEIKDFKAKIAAGAMVHRYKGHRLIPADVPIEVHYRFDFANKRLPKGVERLPKVTKPDITDNTNKALTDALAGVLFTQDQQIHKFSSEKWWTHQDAIHVEIKW